MNIRNILISIIFCSTIYVFFLILKWYRRERRIFQMVRHYKSPPQVPILGSALRMIGTPTDIHNTIVDFCFTYGPNFFVKLVNRAIIFVGKPEDLEKVLMSQSCVEKNELYNYLKILSGEGLFTAPAEKWRRNRKIMNPTFNTRVLENYLPTFLDSATIFVDEILPDHLDKKEVDWYPLFLILAMDTTMQTMVGVNLDFQRKPYGFAEWVETCLNAIFLRMAQFQYHLDFIFFRTKLGKSLLQAKKEIFAVIDKVIAEKKQIFEEDLKSNNFQSIMADGKEVLFKRKAFFDFLLELNHKGTVFDHQALTDEFVTFFFGATDTASVTLCFLLTILGMYQDMQSKIYEEFKNVLDSDSTPTIQQLDKLSYMERCLKETMRLFPPGPIILRQNTGDDLTISDGVIPKGASIGICIYYMHRSELYWKDPIKFDPDRFLPEQMAQRHPYTFLPFSAGLRRCIGQRYAFFNMKTVLSRILSKYRVYCDYYKSIEDIELTSMIVLKPKYGFQFWLEKRESTS